MSESRQSSSEEVAQELFHNIEHVNKYKVFKLILCFTLQLTKQAKKAAESIESAVEASKTKVITKGIVKKGTLEDMNFVRKNVVDDLKNAIDRKNDFMKNLGESAESETCHDVNITLPDGLNNVGLGSSRNGGSNMPMKPNRQLSEPCDIYRKTPSKNNNQKLTVTLSAKPRLKNSETFETTPTSPMRTVDYSKQISHSNSPPAWNIARFEDIRIHSRKRISSLILISLA